MNRGAWVAQSFKHLASAQVMFSRFVGPSPPLGSVLTAQSLEPASDPVSLSLPLPCSCSVSVSLSLSLSLKSKETLKTTTTKKRKWRLESIFENH